MFDENKRHPLSDIHEVQKNNQSCIGAELVKATLVTCPQCGESAVEVDGMLNRRCTKCDWHEYGGFT